MKRLALMAVVLGALGATGCSNDRPDYDRCDFDSDCDSFLCEPVTAEWPGDRITTDGICTRGCLDEFDCDFTATGQRGTCASLGGGPFLCYETCFDDRDCAGGFRCGGITGDVFVCLPY